MLGLERRRSMGAHQGWHLGQQLLLAAVVAALVTCSEAAADQQTGTVQVKLTFPGLSQTMFDQKYANATLQALAASAGVPEEFITRTDAATTAAAPKSQGAVAAAAAVVPTAFVPTATTAAAARTVPASPSNSSSSSSSNNAPVSGSSTAGASAKSSGNTAPPAASNALSVSSSNTPPKPTAEISTAADKNAEPSAPVEAIGSAAESAAAAVSSALDRPVKALASALTFPTKTGSRKLLSSATAVAHGGHRKLAQAADAEATFIIQTGSENWATEQAIKDKLAAAVAGPGYSFYSNLARRGVPYEPTVSLDGTIVAQGRDALSGRGSSPADAIPDVSAVHVKTTSQDKSGMRMIGPLPLWVFVPLVVLGALLGVAALVALGVLSWSGLTACKACCSEDFKDTAGRTEQFITSGPADGEGLVKQPGGGYAPTQGALEKLNASFPTKTSSVRGPESVISNQTGLSLHTNATTAITVATTARSTAGLLASTDGKRHSGKTNNSSSTAVDPTQAAYDYYRGYAQQGKPVPILPHSRLVKPGLAAIKVPVQATTGAKDAAAAAAASAQAGTYQVDAEKKSGKRKTDQDQRGSH